MAPVEIPLLQAHTWETSYRHEDGDLVSLFFVPALTCSVQYDRMTGYFSASALALAARGIERLIANGGRMRLVVGCTLHDDEIKAIEEGYDLREKVEQKLASTSLTLPDPQARRGLEALAWMVAQGFLDVKIAVPTDSQGKPVSVGGIYHEKVGIITDREGNRLSFSGSINETAGGWVNNRESFHVHLSWESGREFKHVQDEVESFNRLWTGKAWSVKILDFPEAAKARLLEFLPSDDRFVAPPQAKGSPPEAVEEPDATAAPPHRLLPDETRRVVWIYLTNAARMENGLRVGEVTSTVKPWPHQVRAYHRLLESWPCQTLLADEVGLGKTITAGLFIRQAWLSKRARRILVMVPRALLIQWQQELYEKFNLNVPIYEGHKLVWNRSHGWQGPLERKVERSEWHKEPFVLCSSHLMRRRERVGDLLQAENWDLLVVDEAHHARRKSPGTLQEGGPNNLLRLLQELRPKAQSLLLLTATPMQVHPVEMWDLLKLLGLPGRWGTNPNDFLRYFAETAGNPSHEAMEHLADLFRESETAFGEVTEEQVSRLIPALPKLSCRKVLRALRDTSGIPLKRLDGTQRKAAMEILRRFSPVRHRMSRHTRALLREYHRRGLIDSPIATREVRDVPMDMTQAERTVYDALGDYVDQSYNNATPDKRPAVGFILTIYQRRLASSFYALQQTLNKRVTNLGGFTEEDVSQDETVEEIMDAEDVAGLARATLVEEERATLRDLLKKIAKIGANTKARALKTELDVALVDGFDSAIIFTQYADTMDYVREYLATEFPNEIIGCYSGDGGQIRDKAGFWSQYTKEQIKQRLKSKAIRFLVCTDAAAEGLNFQFCGVLVNYDLPWNPMKVEQRIGRIDRIGQTFARIRVINLAYRETVEADVYFALGHRINLFEGLVGRLQPILSSLPRKFEEVLLEKKDRQEAARHQLLANLEQATREADQGGLDIDEVAIEAMEAPKLSPPSLTLPDLAQILRRPDILPPGVEVRPLDPGSYAMKVPGFDKELRITTSAAVFDDHFESHAFFSPGGRVFEMLADWVGKDDEAEKTEAIGRLWLVEKKDSHVIQFLLPRGDGVTSICSLDELLHVLDNIGPPASLGPDVVETADTVQAMC